MLKIIGQNLGKDVEVELGDYVPLKLIFQKESDRPHLYWRAGDLESTLPEVEINPGDGQIFAASLLVMGSVGKYFPILTLPKDSVIGVPIVCIAEWPSNRFNDEVEPFQVFVDSSRLLILFNSSAVAVKTVAANNVFFGLSANGSLTWILVDGLEGEKLAELRG
jgi:hypothetical protein